MHAGEVHTDERLVRRLVESQFPQLAGLPVERVASAGTDNALYRLGPDLTVRLPRIDWAVGCVEREWQWVPRLAPLLPVDVPVPQAKGSPGEGFEWPWTVCRWVEGENPSVEGIAAPAGLAADLAGLVAALRSVGLADGPAAGRGVPLERRDPHTRKAIGELQAMVDTDAATAAWEAALAAPPWAGLPVWVHGDLAPGNLLCVGGRLRGVIDWGGAGLGDPACDLMPAWNLLPAGARPAFREALGVDDGTWARGRGWALSVALIQLPYYRDTNPVLAASARHVIGEVLAEHRREA